MGREMNKRIKELAEQAGYTKDMFGVGHWDMPECQKFAELIVRECVGIVNKIVPPGYEDYPDYRDQIEQSFRKECATEIKKHFGVEL
jgi:hypothetical protein